MNYAIDADFFLTNNIFLSYEEIYYGLLNNFLESKDALKYIDKSLENVNEIPNNIITILLLKEDEIFRLKELLEKIIDLNTFDTYSDDIKEKWVKLELFWLYKHKDSFQNVQSTIDELYSDFDYPEVVASLVSYMPVDETNLGKSLYEKWENIIECYL